MRYRSSAAYVLVSVAAAAGVHLYPASAHEAPTLKLRGCEYEDSVNCVWDARHAGNGFGDSFLVKRDGTVVYVSHRVAHALLAP